MDFLNSHLFTSFLLAILYFIIKTMLNRMNTNEEMKIYKKTILKDSLLIFCISYLVLIFKKKLFFVDVTQKTQVYTNEPDF